jgi:uncharacterized membrane protein YhaH (DUF805 family)
MKFISNMLKGRINRRNYILGLVYSFVLFFLSVYIISLIVPAGTSNPIIEIPIFIILTFPLLFNISLSVRRSHDLNKSGYFVFLFVIPLVNLFAYLYLFLSKGIDEKNTYGEPPSKQIRFPQDILNMPKLKIPLWFVIGCIILIVGLIAAVNNNNKCINLPCTMVTSSGKKFTILKVDSPAPNYQMPSRKLCKGEGGKARLQNRYYRHRLFLLEEIVPFIQPLKKEDVCLYLRKSVAQQRMPFQPRKPLLSRCPSSKNFSSICEPWLKVPCARSWNW